LTSLIYNSALKDMASGAIDFADDAFLVTLVSQNYLPDKEHTTVADIGSTVERQPVAVVVAQDTKRNRIDITLGGAEWQRATMTAAGAVYHKADGRLVAYIDFGRNVSSTNGQFLLTQSTLRLQN